MLDRKLLKGRRLALFIFVSPASTGHTSQSTSVKLKLVEFISQVAVPELRIGMELKVSEESFFFSPLLSCLLASEKFKSPHHPEGYPGERLLR